MRGGSQPHLLVEAFLLPQHERPQFGRRPLTAATATKSRHVLHSLSVFNTFADNASRLPSLDDAVGKVSNRLRCPARIISSVACGPGQNLMGYAWFCRVADLEQLMNKAA